MTKADIVEAVAKGKAAQLQAAEVDAVRVLREYAGIVTANVKDFYDEHGNIKPIGRWTRQMGSAVAGIETILKNAAAGDGVVDRVLKLKFWDKVRALEALAKHFGLLVDRVHVTGELEAVSSRLLEARRKAAARNRGTE